VHDAAGAPEADDGQGRAGGDQQHGGGQVGDCVSRVARPDDAHGRGVERSAGIADQRDQATRSGADADEKPR
jgi:hypothetical protein